MQAKYDKSYLILPPNRKISRLVLHSTFWRITFDSIKSVDINFHRKHAYAHVRLSSDGFRRCRAIRQNQNRSQLRFSVKEKDMYHIPRKSYIRNRVISGLRLELPHGTSTLFSNIFFNWIHAIINLYVWKNTITIYKIGIIPL